MPQIDQKTCSKCGATKLLAEFYRKKDGLNGRAAICIACDKANGAAYYRANTASVAARGRRWSRQNSERHRSLQAAWYENNRDHVNAASIAWRAENRERTREAARLRYQANSEKERARARAARATPEGSINDRVRRMVNLSIQRGGKCGKSTFDALGYSLEDLLSHLETKFLAGMTWENRHLWHIDHIKPLAAFSFATVNDPEFGEAWSLSNLRPLWAADNLAKGAKWQPAIDEADAA